MTRNLPATTRRTTLGLALGALAAPHVARAQGKARLVILGGGFGGAAAARFARDNTPELDVTLIERSERFTTCPYGNLVLAGRRTVEQITFGYDGLRRKGVTVVHDSASAIDASGKTVRLRGGSAVPFDRLIVSPGIDLRWGALEGYTAEASERMPHGWAPYLQPITLLRRQLEAMADGGVFIIVCPDNPFRCPPGPYERIGMVAEYLKREKPKSKILALDAKDGFSKQPLFLDAWKELYGPMIEWVGASQDGRVTKVDPAAMTVTTEFGTEHRGDVINVIPPQYASAIAREGGLAAPSGWCPVKASDGFESALVPGIHVVGDAAVMAPMPKSAFAASTQAKAAVATIAARLGNKTVPQSVYFNTCYSHVGTDYGISIVGVYRPDGDKVVEVPNSGGISPRGDLPEQRRLEAQYADAWYKAITDEVFALS